MNELQAYREAEKRRRPQYTVTLPADLGDWVEEMAKEHGVPKSTVIAFALHKHKENRERVKR